MTAETTPPTLVSIEDAAAHYKVSTRTIHRLIEAGDIDVYRIGPKLLRIDIAATDRKFFHPSKESA